MTGYVVRRLIALIPTLLFASFLVFLLIRLIPGDVIDLMLAENDNTNAEETREKLIDALGLDVPLLIQYGRWLAAIVLEGDLGSSLWTGQSVGGEIAARLPITIQLGVMALTVALLLGIPIGIWSAIRQDTIGDYVGRSLSILGLAIPNFWLGTMVVILPAIWWGWSPPVNYVTLFQDPWANLQYMWLPSLVLGVSLSAITMRMMRTMMLEVLRQDYIRTAWAKGLDEGTVVRRHAIRNALIPVITLIGLQLPIIIGGAVIVEALFNIPGMGQMLLSAVSRRDYPIITGVALVIGAFVLVVNLLIDLSYGLLDPRVRYR